MRGERRERRADAALSRELLQVAEAFVLLLQRRCLS